ADRDVVALGLEAQWASARMGNIQPPPLRLLAASVLPFVSWGGFVFGLTTEAPGGLVMEPGVEDVSAASGVAAKVAAVTETQWNCDSPAASADMPTGPLRTWTKLRSMLYLRKNPWSCAT